MQRSILAVMSALVFAGCAASQVEPQGTPVDAPIPLTPTITETASESPPPTGTAPDEASTLAPSLSPTPEPLWSACPAAVPHPTAGVSRLTYIGGDGNLYLKDDGGTPQQLTASGDAVEVQISTDGSLIAYERNPAGFSPELWVIHADGSDAHRVLGKPSIEALNAEITQSPLDYWLSFRWIPYRHELIVEARAYQTSDPGYGMFAAVYRLDPARLSLERFPGPWEAPFSPDGNWFAIPEDNHLSLIRTDGTQAYHKVLDGYRYIGITSFSVLPPLVWLPDGVRLIFPRHDYPDADPRIPPFELWSVPFGGTPMQVGTIEGDQSPFINFIFFAPNGQYYVYENQNDHIVLSEVGGETHRLGQGPLGYEVWWNPSSTHFFYRTETLRLDDVCGNTAKTPIRGFWSESSPALEVKWTDAARAVIMRHVPEDETDVKPPGAVYLFSAADNSLTLIADNVRDADAVLIP